MAHTPRHAISALRNIPELADTLLDCLKYLDKPKQYVKIAAVLRTTNHPLALEQADKLDPPRIVANNTGYDILPVSPNDNLVPDTTPTRTARKRPVSYIKSPLLSLITNALAAKQIDTDTYKLSLSILNEGKITQDVLDNLASLHFGTSLHDALYNAATIRTRS